MDGKANFVVVFWLNNRPPFVYFPKARHENQKHLFDILWDEWRRRQLDRDRKQHHFGMLFFVGWGGRLKRAAKNVLLFCWPPIPPPLYFFTSLVKIWNNSLSARQPSTNSFSVNSLSLFVSIFSKIIFARFRGESSADFVTSGPNIS